MYSYPKTRAEALKLVEETSRILADAKRELSEASKVTSAMLQIMDGFEEGEVDEAEYEAAAARVDTAMRAVRNAEREYEMAGRATAQLSK